MAIDDKIRDGKLQYDINREAAKIALSSQKIDKYEYLAGEEILPSSQRRKIEPAKFTNSLFGKVFKKQAKKQVGVIKSLDSSDKEDDGWGYIFTKFDEWFNSY